MEALRLAIQTRLGERMSSMSSTLVETVSINYEDFNESFLTCGTCLCMYDGNEHTPKLLQCSHTVCLHCLTRIAASQTRDTGSFRCPICRELITIPRGGVQALPPSFLVNQLLDLMSRQRREVIPKCSVHLNQELLFCETCDTVFCTLCTGGSHNDSTSTCAEHTIIPFSIAIKRMSEILLYKANECISKLSQAQEGVSKELQRLNESKESCLEKVNVTFQQLQMMLDKRKHEMVAAVEGLCAEKRKVLEEQHSLIETEKNKVEQECQGLQYQVEVRNITQRIESLSEKLDAATNLGEPRENSFLSCDFMHNDSLLAIERNLNELGRVRTSTTFPSLCTAHIDNEAIAGIEAIVSLSTVDYHGDLRRTGGDPIQAEVLPVETDGSSVCLPTNVTDCEDGTYKIHFRPPKPGRYGIKIEVFERPIKDNPLYFDVTEHNNPVQTYGARGSGKDEFMQPVSVAVDDVDQLVYVLDTGNSRIKVLNQDLEFIKHIMNEGLNGRSCTGIAVSNHGLVVVNWRTKAVTEMTTLGQTLKSFTYNAFQEPIDVAVDKSYGHILVADNGMRCVFVFDAEGKMLFQVGKKGVFNLISSVAIGAGSEIVIADSRIQVFSAKGDFMEVVYDEGKERSSNETLTLACAFNMEGNVDGSQSSCLANAIPDVTRPHAYQKRFSVNVWADMYYHGLAGIVLGYSSTYHVPFKEGKGRYGGIVLDSENRILASRSEQKGRNYLQILSLTDSSLNNTVDSNESKLKRPSGIAVTTDNHVIVVDLGNNCVKKYRYW